MVSLTGQTKIPRFPSTTTKPGTQRNPPKTTHSKPPEISKSRKFTGEKEQTAVISCTTQLYVSNRLYKDNVFVLTTSVGQVCNTSKVGRSNLKHNLDC